MCSDFIRSAFRFVYVFCKREEILLRINCSITLKNQLTAGGQTTIGGNFTSEIDIVSMDVDMGDWCHSFMD